ncbi:MAG: hypothetical protein CMJ46_08020 [Planctomyces sp.]|nr:hypothetical protein [Planctomyces sp.]
MWSRVVEMMLGLWLLMSPFIFRYDDSQTMIWASDYACGSAVIVFSLLSYVQSCRKIHLMNIAIGFWLVGFAYYLGFGDAPPAAQNSLILGMVLLMFAVIPSEASVPAPRWR